MANKDIQEILKKGSKAKLIQLAIDSPEFNTEGLPNPTLTKDEIQTIRDRAKQEGWDGELFRATYKADDLEALTLYTLATIYKALFYLQGFNRIVEKTEVFLTALDRKYLKDYNEKTEKYDTVIKKKPKEYAKDIRGLLKTVCPTINLAEMMTKLQGKLQSKSDGDEKTVRKESVKGVFLLYKQMLMDAKVGLYLVGKSKFAGYRLYSKDKYKEIETVFLIPNDFLVRDAINSLDHIDYLLENFENYLPELIEELEGQEIIYMPNRKDVREVLDYLGNGATFKNDLSKPHQPRMETILGEDYLLSDLKPEEIKDIKERDNKLEQYVRYGK